MAFRIFALPPAAMLTDHLPHGDGLIAFSFIRELAARGHELHVAAGRVELAGEVPANVHVHRLGTGGTSRLSRLRFGARVRRLYRQLDSAGGFDLVHQLTPVEVGVSLAVAGVTTPLVLGPYVPDWPPAGEGADGAVTPKRAAAQARAAGRPAAPGLDRPALHPGSRAEVGAVCQDEGARAPPGGG